MIPRFKKSRFKPKPIETDYWVDLSENEFGGVFKYYDYNKDTWNQIQTITTEKEPQFVSSPAYSITTDDIYNWNHKPSFADVNKLIDELRQEIPDISSGVTQDDLDFYVKYLSDKIDMKANSSDLDNLRDELLSEISDIQIPTVVSAFQNDAGYITEQNLSEKLPDNIVSDENYVHTDNNFTNELKDKLVNLDPNASNYDDTELRNLISNNSDEIDQVSKKIDVVNSNFQQQITVVQASVTQLEDDVDTKVSKEELDSEFEKVYTKAELDEILKQFVTKTHRSYGFCDERPTDDLEITDTGFIFYDYTVNEPIIWVTNEWRILRNNTIIDGLYNIIMSEDQIETIGDWEYITTDDYRFNNLTKYLNEVTSLSDIKVPNIYNGYFVLTVGKGRDSYINTPTKRYATTSWSVTYTELDKTFKRAVRFRDEDYTYYSTNIDYSLLKEDNPEMTVMNCLNSPFVNIIQEDDGTYTGEISNTTTSNINSLTIAPGIKNIKPFTFANISLPAKTTLNLSTGINKFGDLSFAYTNIDKITFPLNPIEMGYRVFQDSTISSVHLSKNIDTTKADQGYCSGLFYASEQRNMEVTFEEGVTHIPSYCFCNRKITNTLAFPRSLTYLGYSAFYNGYVSGAFDSNLLEKVEGWAVGRYNRITSFIGRDKLKIIGPNAFYNYNGGGVNNTCTSFVFPSAVEKVGYSGLSLPLYSCSSTVNIPGTLKEIGMNVVSYYGFNLQNEGSSKPSIDIQLTLNEGIEYIAYGAFQRSGFSCELVLPESLKFIGEYSFGHAELFSNTILRIPKNVQWIGGDSISPNNPPLNWYEKCQELYNQIAENNAQGKYDVFVGNEYQPISEHGYNRAEIKNYLEDGGELERAGYTPFYGFACRTLEAYEVDSENQWFESIDGVLYSKDRKVLVAYPARKAGETYYMEEGCEMILDLAFGRCGWVSQKTVQDSEGTEHIINKGYQMKEFLDGIKTLVLADSFIYMDGDEFSKLYPQHSRRKSLDNLGYSACYFNSIENIQVKETNPNYSSIDGVLYDKNQTTLLFISPNKSGNVNIPDTCTTIKPFMQIANLGNYEEWQLEYHPTINTSGGSYYNYPCGLHIHIPASVTNIEPLALVELSTISCKQPTTYYNSVTIDEANPKYTIDPGTKYIIEKS